MSIRILGTAAGLIGFAAVLLGALGAHLLHDELVTHSGLDNFELAKRYMFYHALALAAITLQLRIAPSRSAAFAGWAFLLGCVLFPGSLIVLSLTGWKAITVATPFGGVCLMLGWLGWASTACCSRPLKVGTDDER